jgi:hypothetical protein
MKLYLKGRRNQGRPLKRLLCETGTGQKMAQFLYSYMMMMMVMMIQTAPLARHRLRNVLFSHTFHFTSRLIVEFWFLKKMNFNFIFRINFPILMP